MEKKRREKSRLDDAMGIGAAVTGGMAAHEGLYHHLRDLDEADRVKKTKYWSDFVGKLEPGDVIFHRTPSKYSAHAEFMGRDIPVKEADVMKFFKGDPYYHGSIYDGKGNVIDAAGIDEGVKRTKLNNRFSEPQDLMAYRPENKRLKQHAVSHARNSIGREYKDIADVHKHGLAHIAGVKSPSKICRKVGGKTLCTEFVAEAYPKILPDALASPADMRHSKDLNLVARYGKTIPVTLRERLLTRVGYPLLKNLKYGLGASALGLGVLSARDALGTNGEA